MKEELLTLLQEDSDVRQAVLTIVEEQLGDLITLREYLDITLDR